MNVTVFIAEPPHSLLPRHFGSDHQLRNAVSLRPFLAIVLLLTTSFALAADVSGRWNGTLAFKGEDGHMQTAPAHADLKQENKNVSGKIWKEEGQQFEIEQGQVSGNEISFKFSAPEGEDEQILIHYVKLTLVSPTEIQGTLEFDASGKKFSGELTLARDK
jgi:hypothetical protein